MGVWVAVLDISPAVALKIASKHNITAVEIRAALVARTDYRAAWEDHPEHGLRLVVICSLEDGREVFAALTPVVGDPDRWNLRTCMPV